MNTYTEEEKKLIFDAANQVWAEVASDYLALSDGKSIPRNEVIEVVSDAGRMDQILERKGHKDLAKKWGGEDLKSVQKILRPVFPYARYGL